ncbi:MAG: hypothetical protein ACRCWQ_02240 [Bacilli bacterium]
MFRLLGYALAVVAGIALILAWGFVWMYQFIVLMIVPPAPADYKPNMETYESYQVVVREYNKVKYGKYPDNFFDLIEGKTTVRIDGEYAVRSDGRRSYVIYKRDDARFGKEDIPRIVIDSGPTDWIVKGCRHNAVGCSVSLKATYRYELTQEGTQGAMPYRVDISASRIKR